MTPLNQTIQSNNLALWDGTPTLKRILPAGSNESEPKRISNHQYLYAQPDQSRSWLKTDIDILIKRMSSIPPCPLEDIAIVLDRSEQSCLKKYEEWKQFNQRINAAIKTAIPEPKAPIPSAQVRIVPSGERWTSEDTKELVRMMTSSPSVNSKDIAAKMGRSEQACISRYHYYLFCNELKTAIVADDPESKLDNHEISRRANLQLDQVEREELISMIQKGNSPKECALMLRRTLNIICKTTKELKFSSQNTLSRNRTTLQSNDGVPSSEPVLKPVSEVQTAPSDSLMINLYCTDESDHIDRDPYDDFFDESKLYGKD